MTMQREGVQPVSVPEPVSTDWRGSSKDTEDAFQALKGDPLTQAGFLLPGGILSFYQA